MYTKYVNKFSFQLTVYPRCTVFTKVYILHSKFSLLNFQRLSFDVYHKLPVAAAPSLSDGHNILIVSLQTPIFILYNLKSWKYWYLDTSDKERKLFYWIIWNFDSYNWENILSGAVFVNDSSIYSWLP